MKLRGTKKERLDYTKQEDSMKKIISSVIGFAIFLTTQAQVNAVEFGKNRVQYQKFKWKYYQSENFNTYFNQDGLELGKFVARSPKQNYHLLKNLLSMACNGAPI
jgi:hypothetical protein